MKHLSLVMLCLSEKTHIYTYICLHFSSSLMKDKNTLVLHNQYHACWYLGPWFNIKKSSYQYRKCHCGDKTNLCPSYLCNGISYTGKKASLSWIGAQIYSTDVLRSPCLAIEEAGASEATVLTYFSHVIPVSAPEKLALYVLNFSEGT